MNYIALFIFFLSVFYCSSPQISSQPKQQMDIQKILEANLSQFKEYSSQETEGLFKNSTIRHFDLKQGNQIEYNAANGDTFLWYPGNRKLVAGFWKIQYGKLICFYYVGNVVNYFTGESAEKWDCRPIDFYLQNIKENRKGNIFDFKIDKKIPFILSPFPEVSLEELFNKKVQE